MAVLSIGSVPFVLSFKTKNIERKIV